MNALTRFFCGREPHPAPGQILRREGSACILTPDAALPPGFPDGMRPETVFKDSRSVTAFLCDGGRFFVKIYKFRGLFHALKHIFRTPRAFRCFAAAEALKNAGFITPEAVAATVGLRFGILPVDQMLLTMAVPRGSGFLDREIATAPPDETRTLLRELAAFTAELHAAGFLHGDLNLRNLYRVPDRRRFGLIDLDGMLVTRTPFPRAAAAEELARIVAGILHCRPDLPKDDCMNEVLRAYHAAGGRELRPEELRPALRRISRHRPHAPARH